MQSQYLSNPSYDDFLRLGDIIEGFSYIVPRFDDFSSKGNEFVLDVKQPNFFAVLTPCCSIEDEIINLCPLKEIDNKLLQVDYYKEDFTRLNVPHEPRLGISNDRWEKGMNQEEKQLILQRPLAYQYKEKFVYSINENFAKYTLKYKAIVLETNCYWIDFKDAFTINAKNIKRGNKYSKILQLTIPARFELRNKIAKYYSEIPKEDEVPR
jgi:hypothetical protein